MKQIVFFILLSITMAGCEGERVGEGYIYESGTNIPLDSVMYRQVNDDRLQYTDSIGHYYITGPFGGCLSECPDYSAEFSKPGYRTRIVGNPDGDIFLIRE